MAVRFIKQLDWQFKQRLAELFNDATAWLNGGAALTGTRAAGKVIGDDGADGIGWVTAGQTLHCRRDDLTATAADDTIILQAAPYQDSLLVWEDGTLLPEADYTYAAQEIELDTPAAGGEVFTVQYWTTEANPANSFFDVPVTVTGDFDDVGEGEAFTGTLSISGGSGSYSSVSVIAGTAPTGATFGIAGTSVTISGTAGTGVASYDWTLRVTDSAGNTGDIVLDMDIALGWASTMEATAPLLWWKLNETSGTVATDYSGNGFHGTYEATGTGTVTLNQPGVFSGTGPSVQTSATAGRSGVYSESSIAALQITGDMTVMTLVRMTATPNDFPKLFGKLPNSSWGLFWNPTGPKVHMRAVSSGTPYDAITGNLAYATDYLLIGRRSETELSIWLNGTKQPTTATLPGGALLATNVTGLNVGKTTQDDATTNDYAGFNGGCAIWDRALSDAEIAALYAARNTP